MSRQTQPNRPETAEESVFTLMKLIAKKENNLLV
jgi:hypothetical protein